MRRSGVLFPRVVRGHAISIQGAVTMSEISQMGDITDSRVLGLESWGPPAESVTYFAQRSKFILTPAAHLFGAARPTRVRRNRCGSVASPRRFCPGRRERGQ